MTPSVTDLVVPDPGAEQAAIALWIPVWTITFNLVFPHCTQATYPVNDPVPLPPPTMGSRTQAF